MSGHLFLAGDAPHERNTHLVRSGPSVARDPSRDYHPPASSELATATINLAFLRWPPRAPSPTSVRNTAAASLSGRRYPAFRCYRAASPTGCHCTTRVHRTPRPARSTVNPFSHCFFHVFISVAGQSANRGAPSWFLSLSRRNELREMRATPTQLWTGAIERTAAIFGTHATPVTYRASKYLSLSLWRHLLAPGFVPHYLLSLNDHPSQIYLGQIALPSP